MTTDLTRPERKPATRRPTRERLIRSAVYHFQQMGYHGTGITAILQRAGAPKGSFYHHFPGGKEEVAVAALSWLRERVEGFLADTALNGGSSALMVEGLAAYHSEGIRRSKKSRGSLVAVLAQDAAPYSRSVADALRAYLHSVRSSIARARASEMPHDDGRAFADGALAIIQGATVLARIEQRPELAVEIVEQWLQGQSGPTSLDARRKNTV